MIKKYTVTFKKKLSNFCPIGDFFKPCPSRAKAGFKKSPSGFMILRVIKILR
jgi:hypothetical protein